MSGEDVQGELLFDDGLRETADRQGSGSHFRWLALSDDPEAVALRAALERCYRLAGDARGTLRKGLAHERWGQHVGALAHLLALGMLARQDLAVETEPPLGHQSPDVLATRRDGARLLVEVRAITGAGHYPWEDRRATGRTLAHDPEKHAVVTETVSKVLLRKAETYRPLVRELGLPYVICLYEDKDSVIGEIVRELAFGRATGRDEVRDPDGGLFAGRHEAFDHVSAVIVLGRLETEDGALRLVGDVVMNPHATVPLPEPTVLPLLREYRCRPMHSTPGARMGFPRDAAERPFTLGDA
ncbi:MAG: hypothetical protein ACYTG2_07980 [Planctomycetota bacterium]